MLEGRSADGLRYDTRMRYMGRSAVCRTTTINEDLGQIGYIFSDKTGTLTANELRLRAVTVGHVHYGGPVGSPGGGSRQAKDSQEFAGLGGEDDDEEGGGHIVLTCNNEVCIFQGRPVRRHGSIGPFL